jgi:geranylgeranyl diphosphate synthase type II
LVIFKELQPLVEQVKDQLQKSVKDEFPHLLKDPIYYFLESSGKKIRPILTLLSCEAMGGKIEAAMAAAVGIELFHNFTLIHDDIMDKDDLRRGRYTVHKRWGEDSAILVGDALIGLAYEKMMQSSPQHFSGVLRLFNETLLKVCEGQALDKEFEKRPWIDLSEYIDMISKKTAWLFKLACQIGAILGGGSDKNVHLMTQFGNLLGIGFQIQDDLLDYIGEENMMGKKVGSDLKLDKKTYITLKYQEYIEKDRSLKANYPDSFTKFQNISDIQNVIISLGIAQEAQELVNQYIDNALSLIKKITSQDKQQKLFRLVQILRQRKY